jgi:hypothetical protein
VGTYANDPVTRRLLAVDSAANYLLAVPLLVAPSRSARLLGLPDAAGDFYARVLGGVLVGIATALAVERSRSPGAPAGLGVAGAIAINAAGGGAVAAWLRTREARALPARGRVVLRGVAAVVVGIGAVEAVGRWCRGSTGGPGRHRGAGGTEGRAFRDGAADGAERARP